MSPRCSSCSSRSSARPRRNSSCSLVTSRAITTWRSGPRTLNDVAQRLHDPVRRFIENLGARRVADGFQRGAPRAGLGRKEAAEAKRVGGQPAGHQRRQERRGAGNRHHANVMADRQRHQPIAGIAHAGRSGIGDQRNVVTVFQVHHQFGRSRQLVVFVIADRRLLDAVVVEQLDGLPGIFAGDQVHFLQRVQSAQSNVFEIADGSADKVEGAGSNSFALPAHRRNSGSFLAIRASLAPF